MAITRTNMAVIFMIVELIIIAIITWFFQYFRYERHLKKVKGPRPIPLLGNALEFGRTNTDILKTFCRLQRTYGSIFKTILGFSPPMLVVTDCKFLEYILGSTKLINKSDNYYYFKRWLGNGLLTSGGAKWKKHRKMITPAFHFQILEQFTSIFDEFGNILIEKLAKEVGKESTDLYPFITLCSLDVICATSMGTIVNAQRDSKSNYVYSIKEMCRIIIERSLSIFKMYDFLYYLSKDYQKEKKAVNVIHGHTYSVIKSRSEKLKNISDDYHEINANSKERKTFLDLLLGYKMEGQSLSDKDIREEVDTFMFEGHDTTASAISFALYCLANNPEIQSKVVEELAGLFGNDKERAATYKELNQMKYLEAVIKETLRLYPSVPFFGRLVEEYTSYDGIVLPKNLTLMIFAYGIHRCPSVYPDPERFDPERFTSENQPKRSPYSFIPFSAGPRNCIGQKYAMLELKAVVSKILRHYELFPTRPAHQVILVPEIVLKSKNGICIRLHKRK